MSTVEELQAELAQLREQVAALTAATVSSHQDNKHRVLSRRNLLRVAPVAAIGAGFAAMQVSPVAAAVGGRRSLARSIAHRRQRRPWTAGRPTCQRWRSTAARPSMATSP